MSIFEYKGLKIDTQLLTENEMPTEIFKEVFALCGVDVAISLLLNMRGVCVQVPTNGMKVIEKFIIKKDYDGTTASIRRIARTLGITEVYIRNVLQENRIPIPEPGQQSFPFMERKEEKSGN